MMILLWKRKEEIEPREKGLSIVKFLGFWLYNKNLNQKKKEFFTTNWTAIKRLKVNKKIIIIFSSKNDHQKCRAINQMMMTTTTTTKTTIIKLNENNSIKVRKRKESRKTFVDCQINSVFTFIHLPFIHFKVKSWP